MRKTNSNLFIFILIGFLLFTYGCNNESNTLVLIKGGEFNRGKNITNRPDESPAHKVEVSDFYYQETLVTVKQFKEFRKESGYITLAEKKGYCMISYEGMKDWDWEKKEGANYLYPFGLDSPFENKDDYPVVCVSYLDAKSYCEFYKMRLPTEAEWEYAARAGSGSRFPWGESPEKKGKYLLNFWQGETHKNSVNKDGHLYLSSVKSFPPNKWGVYDPVGNVWQFTNDYYSALTYREVFKYTKETGKILKDPKGPKEGKTVITRGGSWWCSEKACNGFGLNYRGKVFTYSSYNNNGFRCVKEIKTP